MKKGVFGKYFRKLDLFGVKFDNFILPDSAQFQTIYGALSTIVLHSLAVIYVAYILYLWAGGQFLPKVQSRLESIDALEYIFDQSPGSFYFYKAEANYINNPFAFKNNIITPFIFAFEDAQFKPLFPLFSDSESENTHDENFSNSVKLDELSGQYTFSLKIIVGQSLKQYQNEIKKNRSVLIAFFRCQQHLLPDGGTCASDEEIETFLQQTLNTLYFRINIQSYNFQSNSFQSFPKEVYLTFEPQSPSYQQLMLKPSESEIDSSFLFKKSETFQNIYDSEMIGQSVSMNYVLRTFKAEAYMFILLRLSGTVEKKQIIFPKIGEVLAMIGSVIQVLFFLKIIIINFNSYQMENYLVGQVLQFYYPHYDSLKERLNKKENQEYLSALQKKAREKLNILNTVYEISRIQFLLQSLLPKDNFIMIRDVGINLRVKECSKSLHIVVPQDFDDSNQQIENIDKIEEQEIQSRQNYFDEDDICLLSLEEKGNYGKKPEWHLKIYDEEERKQFYKKSMIKC